MFTTAGTGATAGFAAHQVLALKEGQTLEDELSVAAPLSAVVIGGFAGLLLGRRVLPAFLVAFATALFLGRRIDDALPWAAPSDRVGSVADTV